MYFHFFSEFFLNFFQILNIYEIELMSLDCRYTPQLLLELSRRVDTKVEDDQSQNFLE